MYTSRLSNQPSRLLDGDINIRAIEIPCRYHTGSICLNYCNQISCFKLLCQECIEEHLDHHKKNNLTTKSIKSFKKVRQFCVDKLTRLIQELQGRMSSLKQPKNPQQMLQQANMKFDGIKKIMFQIIQQELKRFQEQLRSKINESFSTIKNLQQVHDNLTKIILQLIESRSIIMDGRKQIAQTIQSVLSSEQKLYIETFSREANAYLQKLSYVDFDISMDHNKFHTSVSDCLKILRNQHQQNPNPSHYNRANRQINASRALSSNVNTLNTPMNRNRSKSADQQINLKLESDVKYLHFFETGSSLLHLIDVTNPKNISKQKISLTNYVVPDFHASILIAQGYIFISGGIVQIGDTEMKYDRLSRFSLKAKGNQNFKKDFAKVKPRSSHSLCQFGDYIYILGGFGSQGKEDQIEAQKTVQKVNIRNGEIEIETKSKYGGANISLAINGSIVKASQEGVQVYNINSKKWTIMTALQNYLFIRGCGWTRISKDSVLVYGGYNDDEKGVDACKLWNVSQSQLSVRNLSCRLPNKEGFLNSPGIILDRMLYVIQNVCSEESQDHQDSQADILQGQRALLCFDGTKWRQIAIQQ